MQKEKTEVGYHRNEGYVVLECFVFQRSHEGSGASLLILGRRGAVPAWKRAEVRCDWSKAPRIAAPITCESGEVESNVFCTETWTEQEISPASCEADYHVFPKGYLVVNKVPPYVIHYRYAIKVIPAKLK